MQREAKREALRLGLELLRPERAEQRQALQPDQAVFVDHVEHAARELLADEPADVERLWAARDHRRWWERGWEAPIWDWSNQLREYARPPLDRLIDRMSWTGDPDLVELQRSAFPEFEGLSFRKPVTDRVDRWRYEREISYMFKPRGPANARPAADNSSGRDEWEKLLSAQGDGEIMSSSSTKSFRRELNEAEQAVADLVGVPMVFEDRTGAPAGRPTRGTSDAARAARMIEDLASLPLDRLRTSLRARRRSPEQASDVEVLVSVVSRLRKEHKARPQALAKALGCHVRTINSYAAKERSPA